MKTTAKKAAKGSVLTRDEAKDIAAELVNGKLQSALEQLYDACERDGFDPFEGVKLFGSPFSVMSGRENLMTAGQNAVVVVGKALDGLYADVCIKCGKNIGEEESHAEDCPIGLLRDRWENNFAGE